MMGDGHEFDDCKCCTVKSCVKCGMTPVEMDLLADLHMDFNCYPRE